MLKAMEDMSNNFKFLLMIWRRFLSFFSGIIDVERHNGIKKWMFTARRHHINTDTMDKILRIFCNSPDVNTDEARKWCEAVAAIWWNNVSGNRQIECPELDELSRSASI